MAELNEYTVVNDSGFEQTFLLNDEDAEARGLKGGDKPKPDGKAVHKTSDAMNKAANVADKAK